MTREQHSVALTLLAGAFFVLAVGLVSAIFAVIYAGAARHERELQVSRDCYASNERIAKTLSTEAGRVSVLQLNTCS